LFREDIVEYVLNDILPHGWVVAMLKVYLDRGAREQAGRVMCVAAALFQPFDYDRFLHEWQPFLDGWGATVFHATDFYPGGGEFRRKRPDGTTDPEKMERYEHDSKRIPEIITAYVHQLLVMTFKEEEYEAIAPPAWRARFGGCIESRRS
jgi:hypothetical protein